MEEDVFDVVVVDDAEAVRAVVKTQLRLSGRFRVVAEGATGRDAVELASRHHPPVLLLDASMPDMDGLAALPAVLAASPSTKIVMLSGFDGSSLRSRAIELGAADFVEKATPIKQLPDRLLAALGATRGQQRQKDEAASSAEAAAETVLAEHLERFRTVFDQAAIGMATLTLTGTVVRVNQALADLIHESPSVLVGRPFPSLAPPPHRDEIVAAVARAGVESAAQEVEHRLDVAGPERWAQSTVAAVRDAAGHPLYLFAQLEDITDEHAALEQLRRSEERFRLMVESVQDYAIFMLDPGGHVTTWNLGAERLKGYTADEILGQHFRVFYPEEPRARRHPEHELEIAVGDGRYEEEGWRVRKDGSRFWANVVITALFDHGNHVGFAKVTRDMTERRRAEANLAATNSELQAVARQTEEFLAITAHELQSPVAAINGAADILVDYWDQLDPAERLETLERITAGGNRIRRLLDDLLTASRLEAGTFALNPEPVPVAEVVGDAVREVTGLVDSVEVTGADGLSVVADRARLVQILTNLLTNARKYGVPPYRIDIAPSGTMVQVRVLDGGGGPAADLQPHLFEKFAKDDASRVRGTGLGLYIVRELARVQGGDAWYEPGHAFVVSLPAPAAA